MGGAFGAAHRYSSSNTDLLHVECRDDQALDDRSIEVEVEDQVCPEGLAGVVDAVHTGLVEQVYGAGIHRVRLPVHVEDHLRVGDDRQVEAQLVVVDPPGDADDLLAVLAQAAVLGQGVEPAILKFGPREVFVHERRDLDELRVEPPIDRRPVVVVLVVEEAIPRIVETVLLDPAGLRCPARVLLRHVLGRGVRAVELLPRLGEDLLDLRLDPLEPLGLDLKELQQGDAAGTAPNQLLDGVVDGYGVVRMSQKRKRCVHRVLALAVPRYGALRPSRVVPQNHTSCYSGSVQVQEAFANKYLVRRLT